MTEGIAFIYQLPSPFILQDRDLLKRRWELFEFRWSDHSRPARRLSEWLMQTRREIDLLFIWFGDLHATVATRIGQILRKPSILVVGGYDASTLEGYGFLSTRAGLRRARGHFRRASHILAVTESVRTELVRHFPSVATKTDVLSTGVDVNVFRPEGLRQQRVLSVAGAGEWKRAWIKGWDRIADAARLLPDIPFRLVGAPFEVARRLNAPPNVTVFDARPQAYLLEEYRGAAVYIQASRTEGLPNTVMEAMSCGCVPVVTDVGGMPELVDGAGYVSGSDPEELANAIREALRNPERGELARQRIVERHSMARREAGLVTVVESLLGRSPA